MIAARVLIVLAYVLFLVGLVADNVTVAGSHYFVIVLISFFSVLLAFACALLAFRRHQRTWVLVAFLVLVVASTALLIDILPRLRSSY